MKIKRLFILLAFALCFVFTSCGNNHDGYYQNVEKETSYVYIENNMLSPLNFVSVEKTIEYDYNLPFYKIKEKDGSYSWCGYSLEFDGDMLYINDEQYNIHFTYKKVK